MVSRETTEPVLPDWLAILVVFRDLLIVGGVMFLWVLGVPARIRPLMISKANTFAQLALAALALLLAGFGLQAPMLLEVTIWLVAFTTVAFADDSAATSVLVVPALLGRCVGHSWRAWAARCACTRC